MRLLADRPKAHGASREALDDLLGRLNLIERHGLGCVLELEQSAQRTQMAVLIVEQIGVFLEGGRAVCAHGLLQLADGLRIQQVILAAFAILIVAADDQLGFRFGERLESVSVLEQRLARQNIKPHAFNARSRAGEVCLDQRMIKPHGLEDLSAAIALQGTDAHLRKGLQQALVDGLDKVFLRMVGGDVVRQQASPFQVVQGLDGQVRIDGAGAVADQQGKVHHLARLAALDDQRHLGAGLVGQQPVMHRGHGQQAGNRHVSCIDAAIGENQQRIS